MADDHIFVGPCRVSFPQFWEVQVREGQEYKPGCALMLDPEKNKADIARLNKAIEAVIKGPLKGAKLGPEKRCLRDGDDLVRPEYEGLTILKANARKPATATGGLAVLNARAQVVTSEDDDAIYSGCQVKAKVRLWAQNNKFGKRVNCELLAIQFVGDDEPLDDGYIPQESRVEGFGAVEETGDPDDWDDEAA